MATLLTPTEIKWIEKKALDVLVDTYGSADRITTPIDVNRIATKFGITLQTGNITKPDVSAIYLKKEKRIITQKADPLTRQTFSIAHELGHFVLHEDKEEEVFYRIDAMNLDSAQKKEEQEANVFAASLLMPEFIVKRLWAQFPDGLIIADTFKVSNVGAYFRLKNLQLVK
jgi:Zn-dependent peptidase ImmA (M78 family)